MNRTSAIRSLAAPAAALLLAAAAYAVPPAGPDILGLYTAEDGSGFANLDAPAYSYVDIHMLLTGCSSACGLAGWECAVELPEQVFPVSWTLNGEAINIAGPPSFLDGPEFAVGLTMPCPRSDCMLLCTLRVLVVSAEPAYFYLHPASSRPSIPGAMVYARSTDIAELRPMGWSSGREDLAVFGLNTGPLPHADGGTIAVVPATWGEVKNAYR
jgi:hypothetical protein